MITGHVWSFPSRALQHLVVIVLHIALLFLVYSSCQSCEPQYKVVSSEAWWHMSVIPEVGKLKQEAHGTSLRPHTMRPNLNEKKFYSLVECCTLICA